MSEQQILNYLLWLKERGQQFFVPTLSANSIPSLSEAAVHVKVKVEEDVSESVASAPVRQLKVVFVSAKALKQSEEEMVTRIASALTLKPSDFAIASGEEAKALLLDQTSAYIVLMGDDAGGREGWPNPILVISHPGAMLEEPNLKVSAWNTLQKLKAAL